MAVPPEFIDEVVSRTDIVSLVGQYVELKQKGKDHWGCCPFHLENSPSFHVVPERNMYKCFGCGKGGGTINFLMEMENLRFLEAVEKLANQAGMQMPAYSSGDKQKQAVKHKILEINKCAARYFYTMLNSVEGERARQYLMERRLSRETLVRFGIGFAPDGWSGLIEGMKFHGISVEDLEEAGLVKRGDRGQVYDRFRNRIMFPIIDVKGDVIGFGGRVMDDSMPKYMNSPETPVYDKSRNLYGLVLAKKTKMGRVLLTEGYMDTIALHQAGFDGAVSSSGTAFTEGQAVLLKRIFKEVVICFDSDDAGVNATQRAIPILEKAGLEVRVLQMRGAKDPDEYIKAEGREAFMNLIDHSLHHMDYRLEQLKKKYDIEDMAQKVQCIQEVSGFLATVESPVEREIYGNRVAQELKLTLDAVLMEVEKERERQESQKQRNQQREQYRQSQMVRVGVEEQQYQNLRRGKAEEGILRVLQLESNFMQWMTGYGSSDFSMEVLGRLFGVMQSRYVQGYSVGLASLGEYFSSDEMSYLVKVMGEPQDMGRLDGAMDDYLNILHEETENMRLFGGEVSGDEALLALQARLQEES